MTPAEMMAAIRAIFTQADADAPEVPPTPDPPAPAPPPVAPLPEAGQQAIVDAVLAALAAQQQANPPPSEPPPAPAPPPAPPVPARQSAGPPANPPTNAKSVLQRLIDGETVPDDEIDKAWDDGSMAQQMNDRAGARTEVRI